MPALVLVLVRGHVPEKDSSHELLGDRRAALRKDPWHACLVVSSRPHEACHHVSNPDLAHHARQAGIVDAVMREEVLVFGGEDRVPDDGGNLVESRRLPALAGQRDERMAVSVVHVADRRKLEADEGTQVREVGAVEVDVMEAGTREPGGRCGDRQEKKQGAPPPGTSRRTDDGGLCERPLSHRCTRESAGASRVRRVPSPGWARLRRAHSRAAPSGASPRHRAVDPSDQAAGHGHARKHLSGRDSSVHQRTCPATQANDRTTRRTSLPSHSGRS